MSPFAFSLILSAALVPLVDAPAVAAARKFYTPFEGTWQVVGLEVNGQKPAEGDRDLQLQFAIAGNQMTLMGDYPTRIRFKLHPDTKPMAMDMDVFIGKNDERREHFEGICELAGDTLKLCWHNGQGVKQRPNEFSAGPDSNHFLLILKRMPR